MGLGPPPPRCGNGTRVLTGLGGDDGEGVPRVTRIRPPRRVWSQETPTHCPGPSPQPGGGRGSHPGAAAPRPLRVEPGDKAEGDVQLLLLLLQLQRLHVIQLLVAEGGGLGGRHGPALLLQERPRQGPQGRGAGGLGGSRSP